MKLKARLLLLYMVSASIFRIDLAFNTLSFNITPAVFFAAMLILYFLVTLAYRPKLSLSKGQITFWGTIWMAAFVFGLTLLQGADALQVKRYILFIQIIVATSVFSYLFTTVEDKYQLLDKFIKHSFAVYILFSVVQVFFFLQGKFFLTHQDLIPGFKLLPQTISHYFPRLSGGFIDPNVAGYFLSFLYILARITHQRKGLLKYFIVLNFLTLSRSAIVVMVFILIAFYLYDWITKPVIRLKIGQLIKYAFLAMFVLSTTAVVMVTTSVGESLWKGVEARISNKDSSTSIHVALIDFALDATFGNFTSLLIGHGFASSALHTSSFFGDDEYGNFHSEYITVLFESGILGSAFYSLIFLLPLIFILRFGTLSRLSFASLLLIGCVILQNVFYQQFLFHYYWLLIFFIWYFMCEARPVNVRRI